MKFGVQLNTINENKRFLASYLGTKRKYGAKIASVLQDIKVDTCYDVFGGSGSLTCQLAPLFNNVVYNEKNKFVHSIIKNAYEALMTNRFDIWWNENILPYYIDTKEKYFELREVFNDIKTDFNTKCGIYFWLNMCCTSSLVRWNTKKSTKENWYFNQAYNGKVVNQDNIKDVLLQGLQCVSNKNFSIYKYDYRDLPIIDNSLLLVDPPYDNTYSGYIPEEWDPDSFVEWLDKVSKNNKVCLFGATKEQDFSDSKNLKPFYDKGWKVVILSDKPFSGVSPHGVNNDSAQDRKNQLDVMLTNIGI